MKRLSVGTRIYNNGDMANSPHFGTITRIIENKRFGDQYEITPDSDEDRGPYSISPAMFSETFKGHGGRQKTAERI